MAKKYRARARLRRTAAALLGLVMAAHPGPAAVAQDLYQTFGGVSIYRIAKLGADGRSLGDEYVAYNTNAHAVCIGFWVTLGENYRASLIGRNPPLRIEADGEARLGTIVQIDPETPAKWQTWLDVTTECR